MGLIGAIFTAVLFFLVGLTSTGNATIDGNFLGWCYIITALVIIVEIALPRLRR